MIVHGSLKDPDGIFYFLNDAPNNILLSQEDKEYLTRHYFEFGDYLNLEYNTETKELRVVKRS